MNYAKVSSDYGIALREAALESAGITLPQLNDLFETDAPFDRGGGVISFGPHFGGEAAAEFARRLEAAGLRLPEDFFVFDALVPEWVQIAAKDVGES